MMVMVMDGVEEGLGGEEFVERCVVVLYSVGMV